MAVVLPQGLDQVEVCEFVKFHKGVQDLDIEFIPAGDETRQISQCEKPEKRECYRADFRTEN